MRVPFLAEIAEGDYMYGEGPLLLIVRQVGGEGLVDGEVWVEVDGLEVSWDRRRTPRRAVVRRRVLEREANRRRAAPVL